MLGQVPASFWALLTLAVLWLAVELCLTGAGWARVPVVHPVFRK